MRLKESRKRCFIFILLIFCASALIAGGTNADAAGSISGKVLKEGSTNHADLNVYAVDLGNLTVWAGSAQTQTDGSYTISGLAPGQYKVYAFSSGTYYLSEWYDNTYDFGTAATVTVNDGQTTPNIDFSLTLGGLIYGKVTPYPITGLNVSAYNVNTSAWWLRNASPQTDGTYVIALPPGQYKVYAEASGTNYASEWYYNAYFASATTVNVVAAQTTLGINFTMSLGGRISGKATHEVAAVSGLTISAYDFSSDSYVGAVQTQADGTYTISGLAPGQYRIYADATGTDYASEWYNNILYDSAIPVNVSAGQTTPEIDFTLIQGGRISGLVTKDGTADPLADIPVAAIELISGSWAGGGKTQADGTYTIPGLEPGQYRVYADASGTTFVSEYYNNALDYDSAATVNINAGQTTQNVDFGLAPGDSITGKVTLAGTTNHAGILVYAYDYSTDSSAGEAQTQADGTYTISGLAQGQYRVYAFASARNYVSEWYNNTPDYDTATPVMVTAGQPTQNIDFGLAAGGSVSGKVALDGTAGYPPPGLLVYAFDAVTNEWAGSARTQTDGTYIISGLAPGQYRTQVSSSGTYYVSEWYNNTTQREAATPVTVAAGTTTTGIDFAVTVYPLATVTTFPAELEVVVDGTTYTSPAVFGWKPGSAHTISVLSPQIQAGDSGTQYEYQNWSDGKAQTHTVTATDAPFFYVASFGRLVGDIDESHTVDIRDAVLALQVVAGMAPSNVSKAASLVYGDKIGIREAIYIIQKVAGLR